MCVCVCMYMPEYTVIRYNNICIYIVRDLTCKNCYTRFTDFKY